VCVDVLAVIDDEGGNLEVIEPERSETGGREFYGLVITEP
jgi:hypothetical protein